jgi:hypothetical protein
MNRSDPSCRPFRPRFCFSHVTTRLRAWLRTAGASRLVCVLSQSKHKAHNHFQSSLEEAVVRRPGRKAGIKNRQTLRAPKVRHRNHAGRDLFTASETRLTAILHGGGEWWEGNLSRGFRIWSGRRRGTGRLCTLPSRRPGQRRRRGAGPGILCAPRRRAQAAAGTGSH